MRVTSATLRQLSYLDKPEPGDLRLFGGIPFVRHLFCHGTRYYFVLSIRV